MFSIPSSRDHGSTAPDRIKKSMRLELFPQSINDFERVPVCMKWNPSKGQPAPAGGQGPARLRPPAPCGQRGRRPKNSGFGGAKTKVPLWKINVFTVIISCILHPPESAQIWIY